MLAYVYFTCLVLLHISLGIAAAGYRYKYLSGPPDQFERFYPGYFPMSSDLLLLPISSLSTNSSSEYVPFPVDNCQRMSVSVLLPMSKYAKRIMKRVTVSLKAPSGIPVVSLSVAQEVVTVSDNFKFLCKSYIVTSPKAGTWQAKVSYRRYFFSFRSIVHSYPVYVLVGFDGSQIILESTVDQVQRFTLANSPVYIKVNISMPGSEAEQAEYIPKLTMFNSNLEVVQPDGVTYREDIGLIRFQLSESGRRELQLTGVFLPPIGGIYKVLVNVSGQTQDGVSFARTQWHLVGVSYNDLEYSDSTMFTLSEGYFKIQLFINWREGMDLTFRVFSEVWGVVDEAVVPICWIIHLTDVERNSTDAYFLPIYIEPKWITQFAVPPSIIYLKNLTIEDVNLFITVLELKSLEIDLGNPYYQLMHESVVSGDFSKCKRNREQQQQQQQQQRIAKGYDSSSNNTKPNLLLVHGYCARENPFTVDNFTNYIAFKDWGQSLSNDQFARNLIDFTEKVNLTAFSIVAHSQGGLAAVHLYSYYYTGLDSYSVSGNGSDRKIQTVGSPYQGTPLAGMLADIGHFFGIMCGSNLELTYEGAQAWLSKVPLHIQSEVHFYRTFYGKRKKYCNFGTNVVLKGANDGLVEVGKARLPFGRGEGISPGECHSVNMQWPSQCHNNKRNAEMNTHAARP